MKLFFLKCAYLLGKQSKCVSKKVGAIIVKNGRIVSTGYNGTPSGYKNCNEYFKNYNPEIQREDHHKWSKKYEIHAEANAIAFAAKNDIGIDGAEIYSVLQPCDDCLKLIKAAGIKKIYFIFPYDKALIQDNDLWNTIEYEHVTDKELINWIENQEKFFKNI